MITNIKNSGDFYRPNQFEVGIFPPPAIQVDNAFLKRICLNCSNATIPGYSFGTNEFAAGGFPVKKIAHSIQYQDLNMTFNLSTDQIEKEFFDSWKNLTIDPIYQNPNYYEIYASGSVILTPKSRNDKVLGKSYRFVEAYPIAINEISVSHDEKDSIGKLAVTMAYHHWEKI